MLNWGLKIILSPSYPKENFPSPICCPNSKFFQISSPVQSLSLQNDFMNFPGPVSPLKIISNPEFSIGDFLSKLDIFSSASFYTTQASKLFHNPSVIKVQTFSNFLPMENSGLEIISSPSCLMGNFPSGYYQSSKFVHIFVFWMIGLIE